MRKKNLREISIIDELVNFQKKLEEKPSLEEMFNQIKMMNFSFRPVQGSIIGLNIKNKHFIEILWSLGKLDEFFNKKIDSLKSETEKEKFINFFTKIYDAYKDKLNYFGSQLINEDFNKDNPLEVEILKKRLKKN